MLDFQNATGAPALTLHRGMLQQILVCLNAGPLPVGRSSVNQANPQAAPWHGRLNFSRSVAPPHIPGHVTGVKKFHLHHGKPLP